MQKNDKLKIIGIEGCEPCDKLKKLVGENADFIDINSEEGKKMIEDGIIKTENDESLKIPSVMDNKGNFCELFISDDVVLVNCNGETRVLYERGDDSEEESETEEKPS